MVHVCLFNDFSKIYWGPLGFLGVSQGSLGGPWRSLGGPWASFRNPWGVLSGSLVVILGALGFLGGSWKVSGGPWGGAKKGPKTHKVVSECLGGLWGALGVILVVWGGA